MTNRVDSPIIAAVLDRLHATAETNDQPVMERAILAAAERSASSDAEIADDNNHPDLAHDTLDARHDHHDPD